MTSTASPHEDSRLIRTLGKDVGVVLEQVGRDGVRHTFGRPFSDLQEFYLTTERRERLAGMGPVKRAVRLAPWLLKALFLKLTPARRLLLVLSFYLMWQGRLEITTRQVQVNFPLLGILVLLLILMLELKDKLLARSELEAGRAVQLALMPARAPQLPGWDVWLFTRSANDVGGDLVDYLQLSPDCVGLALGDVAGKGLPAALLMAKLQATIRALATHSASLGELGGDVNRILNRDGLSNRFATLIYAEVSSGSGLLRLVNAGHMPPLRLRSGAVDELPRGSIALGIMPEADFAEQRVELEPGEVLLVYSDGVSEAMNADGDFFGEERLRATLAAADPSTAERVGRAVLAAADAFVGQARVYDDLSLMAIRRVG